MKKLVSVLTFAMLIAGCTSTQVTTGYYDVKGNTALKLDRELRAKGPANGHALASAAIRFKPVDISFAETPDQCRMANAKLQVIARITLPRWLNRAGADRDLKRGFDGLAAYAKLHEKTHVKIAELAARDMERSLLKLKPARRCKTMEKRVSALIERKLKLHDRLQKKFDRDEQVRLKKLFREASRRSRRSA